MDGDGDLPHDFFSQTASSGASAHTMDGDGWRTTPPRLWGSAGRSSVAGGLGRGSVAGGLGAHRIGLENIDLNTDCTAAAAYPNMSMYTHILQRSRSDGVPQRQGHPPRQGLPPVRAPDRRGKQVVATSGRGGAGSSRSGSGRQRQAAPITVDDIDEEDEEEEDDSMLNQHVQRPKSKANWTDKNTLTLCEIACEEIDAGNFAGRVWSPQAYKNMREKYWERARLWHPGREFRNKMTNLKALYTDWVWLQQQTGCGRGADGEVTATADWWEKEIKDRPNLKKFRKGNPEYMPLLHEMFHEVTVDGSSAYVPGIEDNLEINDDDDLDANEGFVPSPRSTSTQKRGSCSEI